MKEKVTKTAEKYVTEKKFGIFEHKFESSMRSIARSFVKIDERFDANHKVLEAMLKEIKDIHEDNKEFRKNLIGLTSEGLSYERRIENLTVQ